MPSDETVLVATSNCRGKYHLPGEDDEIEPRCNRAGLEVGQFRPRDIDTLPDRFELCRFCDPDYEVARPGHPEDGTLASKLDDADPDELVTDGGRANSQLDVEIERPYWPFTRLFCWVRSHEWRREPEFARPEHYCERCGLLDFGSRSVDTEANRLEGNR